MGWVKDKGASASKKYEQGGKIGPEPQGTEWGQMRQFRMEEGGKVKGEQQKPAKRKTIKHKFSDGTWYEGPDTPEARKRIKETEFYLKEVKPGADKIKAEEDKKKKEKEKAKADAIRKAKIAKDDKEREEGRKIAAKEGLHHGQAIPFPTGDTQRE